mgnify:CR=1 FL=1
MKKRIEWIDLARAFGMFLIIFGHALPDTNGKLAILVYTVNVPIFFVLSGYLYHEQPFRIQVKKLFYNLLLPYFATGFLMLLISVLANNINLSFGIKSMGTFSEVISAIVWGIGTRGRLAIFNIIVPPIGALWFLLALFWADIIFNFLISRLKSCRYFIFIMSIISILIGLGSFISATLFAVLPWSINAGLIGITFMWYGYCLKKWNIFKLKKLQKIMLLLLLVILFSLTTIFRVHFWFNFAIADNKISHDIIALISGVAGSTLMIIICYYLDRTNLSINKYISWFGRNSLIVLCVDCMYGNVISFNNIIIKALPSVRGIAFVESVLFVIILSIIAILLIERIPLLRSFYFNRRYPFKWQINS